ncbi:apoptosis-associated speck-like protein containing a CARD [Balaenoptera musculus]|uniref:Apoptosis-associated speck-like protein containing a CARD n=1 Tax=Balaenoptera musculus TaxID=9771 RepID=A0A8B8VCV6_BALMU|nr:apoptosis-associated speck-like protein containing a CARD [Balaenoptera musculus]
MAERGCYSSRLPRSSHTQSRKVLPQKAARSGEVPGCSSNVVLQVQVKRGAEAAETPVATWRRLTHPFLGSLSEAAGPLGSTRALSRFLDSNTIEMNFTTTRLLGEDGKERDSREPYTRGQCSGAEAGVERRRGVPGPAAEQTSCLADSPSELQWGTPGATGCTHDAFLDALENLTADEFKKFKMKLLSVPLREGYARIPRGTLLPMDAVDLTDKLVSYYLEAYGANLTALVLRDVGMQEVAEQLQETLGHGTVPTEIKAPRQTAAKPTLQLVDQHRAALIARVTDVDGVLDALYGKVLTEKQYQAVWAERTNPTKMRTLFSFAPAWNLTCKDLLLQALRDTQPYLVVDLEQS